MKCASGLFIFALLLMGQAILTTTESTRSLIEAVRRDPANLGAISALAKRSDDPQILPTLRDAFAQARISGAVFPLGNNRPRLSQIVAAHLLERGVRDDIYFDELAKYAREAIIAAPPAKFLDSADGDPTLTLSPAYVSWCASRSLDSTACEQRVNTYTMDLVFLRSGHDQRAISVFRGALRLPNDVFAGTAVSSLAQLDDADSIPLIIQSCQESSSHRAELLASYAAEYKDASVRLVFEACIKDKGRRLAMEDSWRSRNHMGAEIKK